MAFVLIPPLIVLLGGRVDVQGAVRIRFGLLLGVKFILGKGLRTVLFCICCNGCGVQAAEKLEAVDKVINFPQR